MGYKETMVLLKDTIELNESLIELVEGLIKKAYTCPKECEGALIQFSNDVDAFGYDRGVGIWGIEHAVERGRTWRMEQELKKKKQEEADKCSGQS